MVDLVRALLLLQVLFAADGTAVEPSRVNEVIDRGRTWIKLHPVSPQVADFPELVDEGLYLWMMQRLRPDGDAQSAQAFRGLVARFEASRGFTRWLDKRNKGLIEHYHLLLAVRLIQAAGLTASHRDTVVSGAQRALSERPFEHPSFHLAVRALLHHLGFLSDEELQQSLDTSLVERTSAPTPPAAIGRHQDAPFFQRQYYYYALIHEVAVLTDFGRIPPSSWLEARRRGLAPVLQRGVVHAMEHGHIDLLAELILCAYLLGLPFDGQFAAGVEFLVTAQQPDGSWGEQQTPRSNRRRHAVQTAVTALMVYSQTLARQ